MKAKDTLFHINWGDGDNCYCVAPDKATATKRMPEGKDMVNYVVQLDHLYQLVFKAGQKDVVDWIAKEGYNGKVFKEGSMSAYMSDNPTIITVLDEKWQAQKKKWGL